MPSTRPLARVLRGELEERLEPLKFRRLPLSRSTTIRFERRLSDAVIGKFWIDPLGRRTHLEVGSCKVAVHHAELERLRSDVAGREYTGSTYATDFRELLEFIGMSAVQWGEQTDMADEDDVRRVAGWIAHLLDRHGIPWMRSVATLSGLLRDYRGTLPQETFPLARHLTGDDDAAEREMLRSLEERGPDYLGARRYGGGPTYGEFVEALRRHIRECEGHDQGLRLVE